MTEEQAERIRVRHGYDLVRAIRRDAEVLVSVGDEVIPHGGSLLRSLAGDAAAAGALLAVLEPGRPRHWMQGELNAAVIALRDETILCLLSFEGDGGDPAASIERTIQLEARAEEVARSLSA